MIIWRGLEVEVLRKMSPDRNNLIHTRIIFHIKEPFCPPKPSMPDCEVIPSTFYLDLLRLHQVWGVFSPRGLIRSLAGFIPDGRYLRVWLGGFLSPQIPALLSVAAAPETVQPGAQSRPPDEGQQRDQPGQLSLQRDQRGHGESDQVWEHDTFSQVGGVWQQFREIIDSLLSFSLRASLFVGGFHKGSARSVSGRLLPRRSSFNGRKSIWTADRLRRGSQYLFY